MLVVNALDKENVNFDELLAKLRARFGAAVFPMTVPVNPARDSTVLDVMRSEVVTYQTDGTGKYTEVPATGDLADKVKQLHAELIEKIAESDDALMEKFFEQGRLTEEEMRGGVHAAVQKQTFIPLFCTSRRDQCRRGPADGFHRQVWRFARWTVRRFKARTSTAPRWSCA